MYSHTLRKVLKSLSPRKHTSKASRRNDITATSSPGSSEPESTDVPTPATSDTLVHPDVDVDAAVDIEHIRDGNPSSAAACDYDRYLSRISTRAEAGDVIPASDLYADEPVDDLYLGNADNAHISDADTPSSPSPSQEGNVSMPDAAPLSESPPPSPPFEQRAMSRMHRRAMRDVSLFIDGDGVDPDKENGFANANPHVYENIAMSPPTSPTTPVAVPSPTMPVDENENINNNEESSGLDTRDMPPIHVGDPAIHFSDFVAAGSGGSGSVYFARHTASGLRVALKCVTPSTPAKRRALETEIRTMHALQHPNVVRCFGAYEWQSDVWIVMEAMDVGCLTTVLDFLRAKRFLLSEAHIAYILREMLGAVWSMHSRSCMHRDIKSDNLLIASDGSIKLGDFEYSANLTGGKRRTVVGTAWWMSPETVRNSYYDYGADVWSIGILAIECAEWVPPLFGMESAKAMEVIRLGATHQGFRRPDMWSVSFADFVRGCLTRDRDLRYTVPQLLSHPFLRKACSKEQISNVFRAVKGMPPTELSSNT